MNIDSIFVDTFLGVCYTERLKYNFKFSHIFLFKNSRLLKFRLSLNNNLSLRGKYMDLNLLRKSFIYENSTTPLNIVKDLQEIAELDRVFEIEQKKYGKQALYCFFGILSVFFLLVISSIFLAEATIVNFVYFLLFLLLIGFGLAFIYFIIQRAESKKLNLQNYRYTLSENIIKMLARDIDNYSNIDLNLSFAASNLKQHKISTSPHPRKQGWKIDLYQHQWLKVRGQFLDQTRFTLTVTEQSKKQYGWKKGRSGKSKYKTKDNPVGLDVGLTLNYPHKKYGGIKLFQDEVAKAIQVPNFCQVKNFKLSEKSIYLLVRVQPSMMNKHQEIYQVITSMFLSLYQALNLAREISK
jgi:hypothetical protein